MRSILISIVCFAMGLGCLFAPTTANGAGKNEKNEKWGDYPITPTPFTDVRVDDAFWTPRIETNRTATVPYAFEKCEETDRISNFAKAGGLMEGGFVGTYFNDSDVYKVIEGACYTLSVFPDPKLDAYLDGLIAKIAAAQEDDGYLYTARTLFGANNYKPPGGKERWSNIRSGHELYCVGHMYEAAVAHHQATGKRTLLDVAVKNADLICREFGPGKKTSPPGHQEIEIGLAKLYRETGDEKYLRMAKFFLDARGHTEGRERLYGEYSQDHKPVVEQEKAVGHAVRASYMYTGMADIAALTRNEDYIRAIGRIWRDVVGTKLYVTGGVGASGGNEGFGADYDLPNRVAYCETCAAVANVMWNHRLFLLHGEGQYIDVLERTLYNGLISGVALDGKTFFYPNRLESDGGGTRSAWFGCACCPSNIARFIPSVPGYAYATRGNEIFVNLFIGGEAKLKLGKGEATVRQETRYPWDGKVKIQVDPGNAKGSAKEKISLNVRIPGWARNEAVPSDLYRFQNRVNTKPVIKVNGKRLDYKVKNGYAQISRKWSAEDTVEVDLPMPVRRVLSHEKLVENAGKTALQRGPIVYCVEWPDVPEGHVTNLLVPDDAKIGSEFRKDLLGGVQVLRGEAESYRRGKNGEVLMAGKVDFTAIPYYSWAHRGPGAMSVWMARAVEGVRPLPAPTIASTSKATASKGNALALSDQREPKNSNDHANRYLHWWPRKGTKEWVEYAFKEPTKVSSVEVYWFDDTGRGQCRIPASWELFYKDGAQWKPVQNPSPYGCAPDQYNRTTFDPVLTSGLRIEVQSQEKWAGGIHEWVVK